MGITNNPVSFFNTQTFDQRVYQSTLIPRTEPIQQINRIVPLMTIPNTASQPPPIFITNGNNKNHNPF
jgi:hypothetical protein